MWIRDMYFPHEHARKINIWSSFIIIAPFVGPLVSAFIVNQTTWRWVFWLLTMLSAICWVLCVLFLDETFVNRKAIGDPLAGRKSRVLRLLGVEQHQRNLIGSSFPQALKQTALAITKLPVFLSSLYYMFVFAWVIGLNAAINVFIREIYGFRYDQIGTFVVPVPTNEFYLPVFRLLLLRSNSRRPPWCSRQPRAANLRCQNLRQTTSRSYRR
jgi:MFS family permease